MISWPPTSTRTSTTSPRKFAKLIDTTKTSSPLIYEYKDYAVGIVDPEGRLISQSKGGIPLFVANALGVAVRDGVAVHGRDGIAPGDVIFSNHAETLGQHLNNVVMYTPVYAGEGQSRLFGFMAMSVHWIGIGGRNVGSSSGSGNTEIFQEGGALPQRQAVVGRRAQPGHLSHHRGEHAFPAPDEPANDGGFRPLNIVIPEGKMLSATGNAAMGAYSRPLATVVDTVIRAMVDAAPREVAAGHHGDFGIHSISGRDPRSGELFVCHGTMHGGWGASFGHDGPGPFKTQVHGDTLNIPVEVQEAMYPLRIESQRLRPDSGGAGEYRGGLGVEKIVSALAPCAVQVYCDRTACAPWGILGGRDGAVPEVAIERPEHSPERVLKGRYPLGTGDRLRILSGGGYADPRRRDPARVARDVRLGYVTPEAARSVYGVVLGGEDQVLERETANARAALAHRAADRTAPIPPFVGAAPAARLVADQFAAGGGLPIHAGGHEFLSPARPVARVGQPIKGEMEAKNRSGKSAGSRKVPQSRSHRVKYWP